MRKIIEGIQKKPEKVKKIFYLWIVLVALFDVTYSRAEAHFLIDKIYLFWSVFGALGCYLLIKVGKGLAHTILGKDENYYG